jgi:hypothetical protein
VSFGRRRFCVSGTRPDLLLEVLSAFRPAPCADRRLIVHLAIQQRFNLVPDRQPPLNSSQVASALQRVDDLPSAIGESLIAELLNN